MRATRGLRAGLSGIAITLIDGGSRMFGVERISHTRLTWLVTAAISLLLIITVLPFFIGKLEFTGDDFYFIINNSHITSFNLADIWLKPQKEYTPVTLLSFAVEYLLWGANATLFHVTNFLLFISLALAAFCLARRLVSNLATGGEQWQMPLLLATAILMFHPFNVESVASISSRKELLCVLFGLLSLLAYTTTRCSRKMFVAALLCQALAQLSKGSAVVLPLMFLAWEIGETGNSFFKDRQYLYERVLRLSLSLLLAVSIFIFQLKVAAKVGLVGNMPDVSILDRIGAVVRTFDTMLIKLLLPINLCFEYDIPWPVGLPPLWEWLLPAIVVSASGMLICKRQWRLFVLVLLPLLTLLPYLNILPLKHNIKGQLVFYDHYMLFFLVASTPLLATLLGKAFHNWQKATLLFCLTVTLVYSACNFKLYGYWKTQEAFYGRMIALAPELPRSYMFMGKLYYAAGRYKEAIPYFARIQTTKNWFPTFADALRYQGDCLAFTGSYPEAEKLYRQYLESMPRDIKALQNLSLTLIYQGKISEAEGVILGWLSIAPDDPNALVTLQLIHKNGVP